VFFGTYDPQWQPRVEELRDGLAALGHEVVLCHARPDPTAWPRILLASRRIAQPDVVVVGPPGRLAVHLARLRWRLSRIVLDRTVWSPDPQSRADRTAVRRADVVMVGAEPLQAASAITEPYKAVLVPDGGPGVDRLAARLVNVPAVPF